MTGGNGSAARPIRPALGERRRSAAAKNETAGQTRPFRCVAREVREQVGYGLLTGSPLSMVSDDVSSQLAGISRWAGLSLS
jgi:hypothetical protein